MVWAIFTLIMAIYALKVLDKQSMKNWLKETWWFVKLIFPMLLVGVFIVGIISKMVPEIGFKTG